MKSEVYEYLDRSNDYERIARQIQISGDPNLIAYVLQVGVAKIASERRHTKRSELKTHVKETFVQRRGGVTHSVKLSPGCQIKLKRAAAELLTWPIGGNKLGDYTRDILLKEAQKERNSGRGHVKNALFYERLAQPMNETETVLAHWKSPQAAAMIRDEIWSATEDKQIGFLEAAE